MNREPCKDCGCTDWDEYWGPVCGISDCKGVQTICDERDRAVKIRKIYEKALGEAMANPEAASLIAVHAFAEAAEIELSKQERAQDQRPEPRMPDYDPGITNEPH